MLDIYDEFRRLVEAFDAQKVDYALCGGMAMGVHKRPRMTIDIDILIPVVSRAGLIAMKQLRKSGQDLDDIEFGGRRS